MSVRRLEHRPGLGRLYEKAVVSARGRRGDRLPEISVELADVPIDRDHLAGYEDVCGFRHSDVLPPAYPHVLAFPLAVTLMVDPSFPFALPGLIHVANRITQTRARGAAERLTFQVRASDLRAHPRGRQFGVMTEATLNGKPVCNDASAYHRPSSTSPTLTTTTT